VVALLLQKLLLIARLHWEASPSSIFFMAVIGKGWYLSNDCNIPLINPVSFQCQLNGSEMNRLGGGILVNSYYVCVCVSPLFHSSFSFLEINTPSYPFSLSQFPYCNTPFFQRKNFLTINQSFHIQRSVTFHKTSQILNK